MVTSITERSQESGAEFDHFHETIPILRWVFRRLYWVSPSYGVTGGLQRNTKNKNKAEDETMRGRRKRRDRESKINWGH